MIVCAVMNVEEPLVAVKVVTFVTGEPMTSFVAAADADPRPLCTTA